MWGNKFNGNGECASIRSKRMQREERTDRKNMNSQKNGSKERTERIPRWVNTSVNKLNVRPPIRFVFKVDFSTRFIFLIHTPLWRLSCTRKQLAKSMNWIGNECFGSFGISSPSLSLFIEDCISTLELNVLNVVFCPRRRWNRSSALFSVYVLPFLRVKRKIYWLRRHWMGQVSFAGRWKIVRNQISINEIFFSPSGRETGKGEEANEQWMWSETR